MSKQQSTPKEMALILSEEVLNDILESSFSATALLRKTLRIAELLKSEEDVGWIKKELEGYEANEAVPKFRVIKARCTYGWIGSIPYHLLIQPNIKENFYKRWFETINIPYSAIKLELNTSSGFTIILGKKSMYGVNVVEHANISSSQIWEMLHAIADKIRDYASKLSIDLRFGERIETIFEETREVVDKELMNMCPAALEKLTQIYEDLVHGSSELDWSQIAYACRAILQDFTDAIYKPDYLPQNEKPPTREQTKNKLHYTLTANLKGYKAEERKLIEASVDFLEAYFDRLTRYVQKEVHPKGFEVTEEDAKRCVIYTYLIIGDILKLIHARD